MPFKSRAQAAWMFHNNPKMAKEWNEHTPTEEFNKLPYKKKGPDKGSMAEAAAKRRKDKKKK